MGPFYLAQERSTSLNDVIDKAARTPLSQVVIFVAICSVLRFAIAPMLSRTPVHKRGLGYGVLRFLNEAFDAIVYAGVFVFLLIRPFCIQAFKIPSESMVPTLLVDDYIVANKAIYRYSAPKDNDIVVFRPPVWACQPDQLGPHGQVNVDFIKRCVGVPGDVVEVRNGTLYRNGKAVNEPFINEKPTTDFKLVKFSGKPSAQELQDLATMYKMTPAELSQALSNVDYWPLNVSGDTVNEDQTQTAGPFLLRDDQTALIQRLHNLPPAPIPPGWFLMMGDNRNNSFDSRAWGLVSKEQIIGRSEFIWMPFSRWRITR